MAQIFHRSTNFISRFSVFFGLFLAGLGLAGVLGLARSPYLTNQNIVREQPIQGSGAVAGGVGTEVCGRGESRRHAMRFGLLGHLRTPSEFQMMAS